MGGGFQNTASGDLSTVPGGDRNTAGGFASFAAGQYASATDDGSFVWCQTNGATCGSIGKNSFVVGVLGPVQFYTNTGGTGCGIDTSGNINCTGAKNAVVPLTTASSRSRCRLLSRRRTGLKISARENFPWGRRG